MMKSFFKKLAFVMALAMVVSMVAPAAQKAVAAEDKKPLAIAYQKGAVITALNLVEVGDTEDLRFVYAPANWKELDVEWSSSNENVVSVDANGVVKAEAAGTATVTVTVGTETASIEVYSVDTTTFVATMGTADNRAMTELTLKVDEEFDFAFYGIKDYSVDRYKCEWWPVDPEGVITCDEKGLVTAVKPGTAKLTLAVYNLATGLKTDVAACIITVEEEKAVVVAPTMDVKQTTEYAAELTFKNIDVTKEDLEKNLKAYYYVNSTKVEHVVAVDEVKDGVAKVRAYAPLTEGFTYVFEYAEMETSFEAFIGKATTIAPYYWNDTFKVGKAYTNYETAIRYSILNEKGIDITDTAKAVAGSTVEISLLGEEYDGSFTLDTYRQTIFFTQAAKVATVKINYFTGEVDNMGNRVVGASATLPIVSEKEPMYTMVAVNWTNLSDWRNSTTLSVEEAVGGNAKPKLVVAFTDSENKEVRNDNTTDLRLVGHFNYKSTKDGVVSVDANGQLTPNAAGTANILVYYDYDLYDNVAGTVVGVIPVTVIGKREVTTVSNYRDSQFATIATFKTPNADVDATGLPFDQVKFTINVKDQTGASDTGNATIVCNNQYLPAGANYLYMVNGDGTRTAITNSPVSLGTIGDWTGITLEAPVGTLDTTKISSFQYSFTVTVEGKSTSFTVAVQSPNYNANGAIVRSGYELAGPSTADIKIVKAESKDAKFAYYEVSNGVHYATVDMQPDTTAYRVKDAFYYRVVATNNPRKGNITSGVSVDGNSAVVIPLASNATTTVNGTTINLVTKSYGTDTYSVAIYRATATGTNAALQFAAQKSVVVSDSQTSLTYAGKQNNYYYTANNACTIEDLVQECFKFNFGGKIWTNTNDHYKNDNIAVIYTVGTDYNVNNPANSVTGSFTPGEIYFIEKVTFYVPFENNSNDATPAGYVKYEVKVNDYVVIK